MPIFPPQILEDIDPTDHLMKAWNYDPVLPIGGTALTAGTLFLQRLFVRLPISITTAYVCVQTAGATLTNVGFGVYSQAGTLLTSSVNANGATAAAFQSTGLKPVTFTAQIIPPGSFYVGFWTTGTTQPSIARIGSIASLLNANLTGSQLMRFATGTTALTTTAPGTMGTLTSTANAYWVGAS